MAAEVRAPALSPAGNAVSRVEQADSQISSRRVVSIAQAGLSLFLVFTAISLGVTAWETSVCVLLPAPFYARPPAVAARLTPVCSRQDVDRFEEHWRASAEGITSQFNETLHAIQTAAEALAAVSAAVVADASWPNVTLPAFASYASSLLALTPGKRLALVPYVRPSQLAGWLAYAASQGEPVRDTFGYFAGAQNNTHISEHTTGSDPRLADISGRRHGRHTGGALAWSRDRRTSDSQGPPQAPHDSSNQPCTAPLWQVYTLPATPAQVARLRMLDGCSDPVRPPRAA